MTNREIIDLYVSHGLNCLEPIEVLNALKDEPSKLMSKKDYSEYQQLPEELIIYRGCDIEELDEIGIPLGVSWTLDYKVAEFFAYRFGKVNGCVVKAIVPKNRIRFYTNRRHEQEVMTYLVNNCEIVSEGNKNYDCELYHKYIKEKYSS